MHKRKTTQMDMLPHGCKGIAGYALVLGRGFEEERFRGEVLRRDLVDCVDVCQIRCNYFFAKESMNSPRVDALLEFYDNFEFSGE